MNKITGVSCEAGHAVLLTVLLVPAPGCFLLSAVLTLEDRRLLEDRIPFEQNTTYIVSVI